MGSDRPDEFLEYPKYLLKVTFGSTLNIKKNLFQLLFSDSIEASISSVRANLLSLTELLVAELRESPNLGPIMEFCLIENLFKRLCVWALQPGAYQIERVVDQLR